MHLGRYTPEGDCNQSYIYYTPFTQWPFTAYIEGHTLESYGPKWTVPNTDQCSNDCVFEGKARIKYGVPPYTLTHPWMEGSVVVGEAQPCDLGNTIVDLPLTWPNCPQYCPEPFDISVPPPLVFDACNNSIFDMEADDLSVKPAPSIEDPSPVVVCSGSGEMLSFESCAPFEEIAWFGNGTSGYGEVPLDIDNPGSNELEIPFSAFVVWDGCESDTMYFDVEVEPAPDAEFEYAPFPVIQSSDALFTGGPGWPADPVNSWAWTSDGVSPQFGQSVNYVFNDLNPHEVCLEVTTASDCVAEYCEGIIPVAAAIAAPNIITPNGDHLNDFLVFPNLEFFPTNRLDVWNRWGNLVYSRENYSNDWDGDDLPGGTYYYILYVELLGEQSGYLMIEK
jgi:gliding motility-associated-like protein